MIRHLPNILGILTFVLLAKTDALSPNGSHVCSQECRKLEWKYDKVYKSCGFPWFKKQCEVKIRRPHIRTDTCYECCTGWRQSDKENCNIRCRSGAAGISGCEDLPDGWYQLCDTCRKFAHCDMGQMDKMKCPLDLQWDDNSKMCIKQSKTCLIDKSPEGNEFSAHILPTAIQTEEDRENELTNEIEPGTGYGAPRMTCGTLQCVPPARCIMMFGDQVHHHMTPKCICPPGLKRHPLDPTKCSSINECRERSPCVHGQCVDKPHGFSCRCDDAYRGRRCDKPRRRGRKSRGRARGRNKRRERQRGRNSMASQS